jgi:hypothetical protein
MRRLGVASLLALVGCGEDPPAASECGGISYVPWVRETSFDQFPGLRPSIRVISNPDTTTVTGQLFFSMRLFDLSQPIWDDGVSYCPQQDANVTATVGMSSAHLTETRWACTPMRDGALCRVPEFTLVLAQDYRPTEAELVLADDSTSLTYSLGDALVERTISLVGQSAWTFTANQPFSIAWSPATQMGGLRAVFVAAAGGTEYVGSASRNTDGTIAITIPDATGDGTLAVTMTTPLPYADYTLTLTNTAAHAATFVP